MAKPFHLAMFTSFNMPAWRGPWAGEAADDWWTGDYHISLIKQMERAGFDFIMFEDSTYVGEHYGGSTEVSLKHPLGVPKMDPFPLLPILARETKHIGLIATGSSTFYPPYILARVMATMDHLTGGRVGWNVVTSSEDIAAQNYGIDKLLDHDERYDMADEFVEVVKALWDSWEPDAIVQDRENGVWGDHTKVHTIDHVGTYFKVRGPLNFPAGPQGHPVICQAGGSEKGRALAAKHANAIVATNPRVEYLTEYRADIRARAEAYGRDPDEVKVLFQVSPVLAETDEAAKELYEQRFELRDPLQAERTLAGISGTTEIDFSQFDLDEPFPQDLTTNGHQSILDDWMRRNKGKTLRQAISERTQFGPPLYGTNATVADQLEAIADATGGDGFLFMFPTTRRYIDEVCSGLAPELRRRGLIREDYPHATFKENLLAF
ncbi:MAG: NtaA/DmoA family FMN-dependent monooxygenase [Nocardioides sp.]|uniref:NtaA/DmoA family FMN-dependent monooxygenase n=1 Tax=Nocardioides sp. TaxID=35761 RepID=UPI0039E6C551